MKELLNTVDYSPLYQLQKNIMPLNSTFPNLEMKWNTFCYCINPQGSLRFAKRKNTGGGWSIQCSFYNLIDSYYIHKMGLVKLI